MSVNLISEEKLRLALAPYRVDPEKFEAAVRERAKQDEERGYDPLATMSPLLKTAAAFLPFEVFTAGRITRTAVESASIAGLFSKLLGYAAFPAISLFVLLGSTIFGVARIRKIQKQNSSGLLDRPLDKPMDRQALRASTDRWWHDHRWGRRLLYTTMLALPLLGGTWLLFLGYIVSTLILLYILKSFAGIGIGNRLVVGQSCVLGLLLLGQMAAIPALNDHDIHLIDQPMLVPLFFIGAAVIALVSTGFKPGRLSDMAWGSNKSSSVPRLGASAVALLLVAVWFMNPILWPATPARLVAYVESFDRAEFSSASWHQWEIVASWAVKSKSAPDLSRPRRLLAEEIAGEQDPYVLGSAFHVGLVGADQVSRLRDYEERLRILLDAPSEAQRIALGFDDWVVQAAVLRNDLTPEQRDFLAARLHATLRWSLAREFTGTLNDALRATQLLEAIGRPVDPSQYQKDIHAMLERFHIKTGIRYAGGFKSHDAENIRAADLNATSDAVELMEFYGIPKDLDMNWVRSSLRPSVFQLTPERWITAVTRDRLNRLPGITRPSWFEILYYDRSFLAAVILIGLCLYATVISPSPIGVSGKTNE